MSTASAFFFRHLRNLCLPPYLVWLSTQHTCKGVELTSRCLFIFGSALAGLGYHPPPDVPSTSAAGFELGKPVHEPVERRSEAEIMAERRKMEELWGKMKRPKDVSLGYGMK